MRKGFFTKEEFRYDPARDVYICPAGKILAPHHQGKLRDSKKIDYSNPPPLPSCRLASLRRSLMEPPLRTSRSPASPRPCPIPGVSRSGASDCDVSRSNSCPASSVAATQSPETNAQPKTAFPLKKRIVCRPKSLPKLWTSCRRPPDSPRVPCEPVSVCNRTGLCPTEMEIEKWRPETGAQNPPRTDRNGKNCRTETGACQPNPRKCRGFSHIREIIPRRPDSLADEPVSGEPVCEENSLLAGNLQGIFPNLNQIRRKVYG